MAAFNWTTRCSTTIQASRIQQPNTDIVHNGTFINDRYMP